MLVIISDLHLADGTCGRSISPSASQLFLDRLKELVLHASLRASGVYEPIGEVDLLLMGDIFELQHSTLWLTRKDGSPNPIRPWSDIQEPGYVATIKQIVVDILSNNVDIFNMFKSLASGRAIFLPPANRRGQMANLSLQRLPVKVNIHYMVGNHDWQFHLPGNEFNEIRQLVINALGLSNGAGPFPHVPLESQPISAVLEKHKVFAQHGDLHDSFNFDKEQGRDSAALGDAFAVEIINRFPVMVSQEMQAELPSGMLTAIRELVNVRPVLATPLWISSQLRQNKVNDAVQRKLKHIWDDLGTEFLGLPFIRAADKRLRLDIVDGLKVLLKLTDAVSFKTLDSLVLMLRKKLWSDQISLAQYAIREDAFLNRKAQFIVYGHTHFHEVVPLDSIPASPAPTNQMYLNSGTWHTYFDLAVYKPEDQKFIPYQVLTYLAFYKEDERGGRRFEAWSGTFSN